MRNIQTFFSFSLVRFGSESRKIGTDVLRMDQLEGNKKTEYNMYILRWRMAVGNKQQTFTQIKMMEKKKKWTSWASREWVKWFEASAILFLSLLSAHSFHFKISFYETLDIFFFRFLRIDICLSTENLFKTLSSVLVCYCSDDKRANSRMSHIQINRYLTRKRFMPEECFLIGMKMKTKVEFELKKNVEIKLNSSL